MFLLHSSVTPRASQPFLRYSTTAVLGQANRPVPSTHPESIVTTVRAGYPAFGLAFGRIVFLGDGGAGRGTGASIPHPSEVSRQKLSLNLQGFASDSRRLVNKSLSLLSFLRELPGKDMHYNNSGQGFPRHGDVKKHASSMQKITHSLFESLTLIHLWYIYLRPKHT